MYFLQFTDIPLECDFLKGIKLLARDAARQGTSPRSSLINNKTGTNVFENKCIESRKLINKMECLPSTEQVLKDMAD